MKIENVILDLDETLISSIEIEEYQEFKDSKLKDKTVPFFLFDGYYYIYERPGVQAFLDELFANYNVLVWTAAAKDYAISIIENVILTKPERKLDYIFFTYHCKLSTKKYKNHKQLKQIWEDFGIDKYNENNTVIIDDKTELKKNQDQNVINCIPYDILDDNSEEDKDLERILQDIKNINNSN